MKQAIRFVQCYTYAASFHLLRIKWLPASNPSNSMGFSVRRQPNNKNDYMAKKLDVNGNEVSVISAHGNDYISLTDIARFRNGSEPFAVINNWFRSRSTIEFLGLWEKLSNPNFKPLEFERFRNEAGSNYFVLSPQRWIEATSATGISSRSGRYGGTFAHTDIAFEFASWISPEFKLYLIKEFQRLKQEEQAQLDWSVKRELAAINYRIHTDAIKLNLIPPTLTKKQITLVYASEADVLNMALFGMTAKEWRDQNSDKAGNMRDHSTIAQLICLSNLENLNAMFISEGETQSERLRKLNQIAIDQMRILADHSGVKKLSGK
jgi:hypothetical protein